MTTQKGQRVASATYRRRMRIAKKPTTRAVSSALTDLFLEAAAKATAPNVDELVVVLTDQGYDDGQSRRAIEALVTRRRYLMGIGPADREGQRG